MTKAIMYWNRMRMEVQGHANADEKGKDIVCAGVSMITGALIGMLEEAEARGRTMAEWKWDENKALLVIWADPNMGSLAEIKAYFRMCIKGLRMLHDEYPRYVDVKEVN